MKRTNQLLAVLKQHCTFLLAGLLVAAMSSCASTPTHWVDVTGQSRPDSQFKKADAICTKQIQADSTGRGQNEVNDGLGNSFGGIADVVAAAGIVASDVISGRASDRNEYKRCMEQEGWYPNDRQSLDNLE